MKMGWKYERNFLLISLFCVWAIGETLGSAAWFLVAFLFFYLVFQLHKLQVLYDWAQRGKVDGVPLEGGIFGQLAQLIHQQKKQRVAQKVSVSYQLERFRKLVDIFPDGIIILSLSNKIIWFNDQASTLLALKKEDKGKFVNHLIRHPHFISLLKQQEKDGVLVMEASVTESSFSPEKIEVRILPYGDDERMMLVRNVTLVERANQVRKDFISNASHELRTPLTVLKGYVEMLINVSAGNEKLDKPLKKIDQQAQKMQTLIEELLQLSKLDEGRVDLSNKVVSIDDLFEQLETEFQSIAEANKQTLIFEVAPGICLKGNENSLLIVLRNLVANALNYTEQLGEIRVAWSVDQSGESTLMVKDSGRGIAARHLARLTERFYRVPENNLMHKSGTGLGLAIVKHELERHGAKLVIDSRVGEGSRFQCLFPANRLVR